MKHLTPIAISITAGTGIAVLLLTAFNIFLTSWHDTQNVQESAKTPVQPWQAAIINLPPAETISLATALLILAAATAAAWKFSLFREAKPHLTISQQAQFHDISPDYRLIAINTTLHNTSKVLVTPTTAWCRLYQTAPLNNQHVEYIYQDAIDNPSDNRYEQFAWGALGKVEKSWPKGQLTVEPNEKTPVAFQFIIPKVVTAVQITTAINKPDQSHSHNREHEGPDAQSWMCYTFLELDPPNQKEMVENDGF